jgi:hypothetical protein
MTDRNRVVEKLKRVPIQAAGLLVALAVVNLALFQNCADVGISKKLVDTSEIPQAFASVQGRYCTQLGLGASQKLKIIFILDLSLSNVGAFNGATFQTSLGTDPQSLRFQAMKSFIDSCGSLGQAEYAVVGFATNRISSQNGSCTVPFLKGSGAKAAAKAELDSLFNIERANLANVVALPGVQRPDLLTSYEQGLTCASELILEDAAQATDLENTNYQVFFVTDGAPTVDSQCPSAATCDHLGNATRRTRQIMSTALSFGAQARVQPVYYGNQATPSTDGIMSAIASAGRVENFVRVGSVDQVQFCSLLSQANTIRYTRNAFFATPLTLRSGERGWQKDSDVDGVPDDLEASLGLTVGMRRTHGLLDSICRSIGAGPACQQLIAQTSCAATNVNSIGLSDCDVIGSGQSLQGLSPGTDSDFDGIPDMLEVFSSLEPGQADATLDSDGDGWTNLIEIRQGSNPQRPDRDRNPNLLLSVRESRSSNEAGCPAGQEVWEFRVDQIPLMPIPAFADSGVTRPNRTGNQTPFDLSHGENEHLVYVGYRSSPISGASSSGQIWGALVRIPANPGPTPIPVEPSEFRLLGEPQP